MGGWLTIDSRDYQFEPAGYIPIGFVRCNDIGWMCMDSENTPVGGWALDSVYGGSYWYYLDPEAKVMRAGWLADGGSWYYLAGSGTTAVGWVSDGGTWYYLSVSDKMVTGWASNGDIWYYLSLSGVMLTGTHMINGRTYVLDDLGV